MAIEINGHTSSQLTGTGEGKAIQQSRTSNGKENNIGISSQQDVLSLTDTAALLQKLQQKIADLPVVNDQKVAAIRQQIANGNYQIDAGRVATKMMAFERALSNG